MMKKPVTTKVPAEHVVRDIRRATRKLHSSEEKIRIGPAIQLAYCWADARRKLIEITRTGPASIAEEGVALIRDLYAVEADIRGSDPATRMAVRQERSAPILSRLNDWLAHRRARASAKSPLGEALAYIAKYREGPGRFLTDGRVEIDSNTVECTIRPIALNRRSALFAGHDAGAENRAVIASLIETCKANGVDPHAWLTAIAKGHKQSQIDNLLPWNYAITV
jgi:transposase